MTEQAERPIKVIKRYANRKLYDTERSCYVTLEEISLMIKDGDDVRVIDNKTKDDLTAVTLAQIIVEEEKRVQRMPLKLLKSIIQSGNEAFGELIEKRVADPVKSLRDDVERRVEALWKRDRAHDDKGTDAELPADAARGDATSRETTKAPAAKADAAKADAAKAEVARVDAARADVAKGEHSDEVKAGVLHEFMSSTTDAFDAWQKRIDERVKDALARATPRHGPDVEALKKRVEELETRLRELEARRPGR